MDDDGAGGGGGGQLRRHLAQAHRGRLRLEAAGQLCPLEGDARHRRRVRAVDHVHRRAWLARVDVDSCAVDARVELGELRQLLRVADAVLWAVGAELVKGSADARAVGQLGRQPAADALARRRARGAHHADDPRARVELLVLVLQRGVVAALDVVAALQPAAAAPEGDLAVLRRQPQQPVGRARQVVPVVGAADAAAALDGGGGGEGVAVVLGHHARPEDALVVGGGDDVLRPHRRHQVVARVGAHLVLEKKGRAVRVGLREQREDAAHQRRRHRRAALDAVAVARELAVGLGLAVG
mmetsp:Transcript_4603/g.9067  ORF Transcript_4603/g.9067 Transcript_4603/m.9067 type:complete len:297 (+) Transcript_4603:456-1346(+)